MTAKELFVADTKKAMKANKQASREPTRTLQHFGGSSEGAEESDNSYENVDDIPWVSISDEEEKGDDDDDRSIDIEETNDERINSDNGDQAMTDAKKNVAEKTEVEQGNEEQVEEDQDDDDQDQQDQTDDHIIRTLPEIPRPSSSHSLSLNYGNQFLNLSSDASLVEVPNEPTAASVAKTKQDVMIEWGSKEESDKSYENVDDVPWVFITDKEKKGDDDDDRSIDIEEIDDERTDSDNEDQAMIDAKKIPTVLDLLPVVVQRVYVLEKEVKEIKQVDLSTAVLASFKAQVPLVVNEYLGSTLGDTIQKVLQKHTKELFSNSLRQVFSRSRRLYERHPTHKAHYDALLESIFMDENDIYRLAIDPASQRKRQHEDKDEDPFAGSDQGKKKRKKGDKSESSKKSSTSKESAKEADQPQSKDAPKTFKIPNKHWFKQPPRPPTPDPKWNIVQTISDEPEQTWFKDLMHAKKPSLTFDELMETPIDFLDFEMNRLKIDNLTLEVLLSPVYNILKGDRCPFDLSKPLSLKGRPCHLTVAVEYFFNNDFKYLKLGSEERKYTTSITKTK
nr:hypothetical protein [Tanacetum cinerariifolium]